MNLQQPGGCIGKALHGTDQLEGCIRLLREKDVESNQLVIARALDAIVKRGENFDRGSLFRVGKILDEYGLGGSKLIRAVVFAYAEAEDHPFVIEQIPKAIEEFQSVLNIYAFNDITEPYRGKLVFKPGVKIPGIYHVRLLAFTQRWRNSANMTIIANAIQRLVELSPIPDIKFRYKGQIIGYIPQVEQTYAYFHSGSSHMNEHQLAIGESTLSQKKELKVDRETSKQIITIEQAMVFALQRRKMAREAIKLITSLVEKYGFLPSCGSESEALCIARCRRLITGMWDSNLYPSKPSLNDASHLPPNFWLTEQHNVSRLVLIRLISDGLNERNSPVKLTWSGTTLSAEPP